MAATDSLDPNSLGDQPQPQGVRQGTSRTTIILWLVVIGLAAFFLPLNLISASVQDDIVRLEANLQPVQATLAVVGTPPPDIQELVDELTLAQQSAKEIEQGYLSLDAQRVNWPAVMAAIGNYSPDQLSLDTLSHADSQVTLTGRAIDESTVVAYARQLEESRLFARVVIQSVRSISSPFVTPTTIGTPAPEATVTSTVIITPTATPTPTPNPLDEFETDDFKYTDIILGQAQRHNFNPIYDVDKVKFLAKAGRFYRIFTFDLTPGVDTFLTVEVGGIIHINDDRQPAELESELAFQVTGNRDVEALVKVTNRGQYSPDMWYQIAVEEIIPTPTPLPTDTPVPTDTPEPTPTGTPAPSAIPEDTPVPADTPTSTPDLRDEYEPNDTSPQRIAVGETQTHNFYPSNDVDRVNFYTKAGRDYLIRTSELALGVDTKLEVTMGSQRWENDDYDLPGSGNFASAVCLQAPSDGTAEAAITNLDQQYGPDKRYDISVSEAPMLDVFPTTLNFGTVAQGTAGTASQQINIEKTGDSELTWEARSSADWLAIEPSSGNAPSLMQVTIDINGLPPANYEATIIITGTSLCTTNSPQTVTVSLQVVAPAARAHGLASFVPGSDASDVTYSRLLDQHANDHPVLLLPGVSCTALQCIGEHKLFPSIKYDLMPSALNAEAFEFVIVLELKAASP